MIGISLCLALHSPSLRKIPIFEAEFLYDFIYSSAMEFIGMSDILERGIFWSDKLKSREKICLLEQKVLNSVTTASALLQLPRESKFLQF